VVVADISIIPLVEGSLRPYIDTVVQEIKKSGLKFEVGAMSTTIEGELTEVLEVAKKAHRAVLGVGANRVVTTIRIDERKDSLSIEGKIEGYR
jgi:uncharacterized protein (TIGR00106 family)